MSEENKRRLRFLVRGSMTPYEIERLDFDGPLEGWLIPVLEAISKSSGGQSISGPMIGGHGF